MVKRLAPFAFVLSLVLLSSRSQAESNNLKTFAPPNDKHIKVGAADAAGIDEAAFNSVMDKVEKFYAPIIKARGATLVVNRLWTDDTVNASAEQQGGNWIINMYGGLARNHFVTWDAMALVACHELGHHLGGYPKYGGMDWASNEGQSDYHATAKCAHRILSADSAPANVDPTAVKSCQAAYKTAAEVNLCERNVTAGIALADLLAELGGEAMPQLTTPDPSVVDATNDNHPAAQCRLDTYYMGAICTKPYTEDFSQTAPNPGACTASQGFKTGLRPRCWYKPQQGEAPQFNTSVASMPNAKVLGAEIEAFQSAVTGRGL